MSSNLSLSLATSKTVQASGQNPSVSQSQINSYTAADHTSRRGAGNGSLGAGSSKRPASSTPRNTQSLRRQHKGHRRPRLVDEDAIAESVSIHAPEFRLVPVLWAAANSVSAQAVMQSTSSRKGQTSITHLMNFSLPPRPHNYPNHHFGRNIRKNPTWGLGSGYHAIDKAR